MEKPDPTTMKGTLDIVRTGEGFANQAGVVELREDASADACKELLGRLCRHLTAGQILAAEEEGHNVTAVFKAREGR